MEISNLKEFRVVVMKCTPNLREEQMDTMRTSPEIENISNYQTEVTELKNTITKLKNTLEGFNSSLDEVE